MEQTIISDEYSVSRNVPPDQVTRPNSEFSAPPSSPELARFPPGTVFANRYRIVSLLGRGGMGEVYRADDLILDQPVALKFLPEATTIDALAVQRIRHEARLARRVTHPNVCRVHDIGEWEQDHFLSMEFIEGEDLSSLLKRVGALPAEKAFDVVRQVTEGLAAAHARGVLHRDLKPGNILIDPQGRVVITDFGLALPIEQAARQRSSAGTLPYMAPEQVFGDPVNERSDLYALGLVIHDVFSGKRVFRASNNSEMLKLRRTTLSVEGRIAAGLDPAVRRIIEHCLAQEPADRPESAKVVLQALAQAESPGVETPPEQPPAIPQNLPTQLTSFIGRERERGELRALLGQNRLVTLFGPGGAGKTRLSLQVAGEELAAFPDGVWMIELAPLADPSLVPQTVATVLGIREAGTRPVVETIAEQIGRRRMLLILDNCEHLVAACMGLADRLLKQCPGLKILASSRERLSVPGEATYQVPSLSLPPGETPATAAAALSYEAVALFVDRARSAGRQFELTDHNAAVAARICRRLDGIPLALELAAARTRALSLEELERRLDDCFRILTGGSKTLLPRQQTLRALIDWSYDLLGERERQLLSRLSVFAGNFSLDGVEQVCSGDDLEEFEVLDLLTSLVDKSLVSMDNSRDTTRYALLETVRQYAREKLELAGATAVHQRRHLEFYLKFAQKAGVGIDRRNGAVWADRFELEHDNLRTALDYAIAIPELAIQALEIANSMWVFWYQRGYYRELAHRMPAALAATSHLGRIGPRAQGLLACANARLMQGDYAQASQEFEESLAIRRELAEPLPIWNALVNYGNALNLLGDLPAARKCLEEALALSADLPKTVAGSRCNLGETLSLAGEVTAARGHLTAAREAFRNSGNMAAVAEISNFLGRLCLQEGSLEDAESLFRHALQLLREQRYVGFGYFVGPYCFAGLAVAQRDFERAARLLGAHDGQRDHLGAPLPPVFRAEYEQAMARVREALGDEQFARCHAQGRAMSEEQAAALALRETDGESSLPSRAPSTEEG